MFEARMNEHELALLLHLHSNAKGYGVAFPIATSDLAKALQREIGELHRDISYLKEHDLVGVLRPETATVPGLTDKEMVAMMDRLRGKLFATVYLTGLGENFCRMLDDKPGVVERGAKVIGAETLATARIILTELIKFGFKYAAEGRL